MHVSFAQVDVKKCFLVTKAHKSSFVQPKVLSTAVIGVIVSVIRCVELDHKPHSSFIEKKRKSRDAGGSGNQSATGNLARTLRNRYSSSEYERVRTRNRPLPNPADEWDENGRPTDTRRCVTRRLRNRDT